MKPCVWGRKRLNLLFEHNFSLYLQTGSGKETEEDWCMDACFWLYYMTTLSKNLIEMPSTYYFNSMHLIMNSLTSILLTVLVALCLILNGSLWECSVLTLTTFWIQRLKQFLTLRKARLHFYPDWVCCIFCYENSHGALNW